MLDTLRTGKWLTSERLKVYPLMLLALMCATIVVWIALSEGLVDPNGRPIGTDFSNVYAAGELTLKGSPEAAYDPLLQHKAEQDIFDGRSVPFYGWHYPPMFLFVAAALAVLPYGWALFAWMALTLTPFLAVVHGIIQRKESLVLALAFPAVFINLGHGQNGFLTAALLGGSLLMLDRRPVIAGILIGILAYKPQFGILIPIVLAATGRWQVFAAASGTVLVLCATTVATFGTDIWLAFMESTAFTRNIVLENGGTGWEKIQSVFSATRMWGAGLSVAYAAQLAMALAVASSLVWLWRSNAAFALQAAALATGCVLATPYVLDYDLVVLALPIAFFVSHGLKHGFRDFEISLLAMFWAAPLLARSIAGTIYIPLGLFAMAGLYILILHRATSELSSSVTRSSRLAQT